MKLKILIIEEKYTTGIPTSVINKFKALIELEINSERKKTLQELLGLLIGKYSSIQSLQKAKIGIEKKYRLLSEEYLKESFIKDLIKVIIDSIKETLENKKYLKYKDIRKLPETLKIELNQTEWKEIENILDKYIEKNISQTKNKEFVEILKKYNIQVDPAYFKKLPSFAFGAFTGKEIKIKPEAVLSHGMARFIIPHELIHKEQTVKKGKIPTFVNYYFNKNEANAYYQSIKTIFKKYPNIINRKEFNKIFNAAENDIPMFIKSIFIFYKKDDPIVKRLSELYPGTYAFINKKLDLYQTGKISFGQLKKSI